MRTSRLTAILERTLDAKAAQATDQDTAAIPAFDPERPMSTAGLGRSRGDARVHSLDVVPDGPGDLDDLGVSALPTGGSQPAHCRPWLLVSAAACVVMVALAGAVLLPNDDDADVDVRPLQIGDPPAGWLVPTWLPDDMELWGMDTSSYQQADGDDPATIPQLFGDPGLDRAIYVTSHRYEISPDTAEDVTVRGTTGSAGTGWGAAEEELGDAVSWEERGVSITALFRGVARDEAIAALDALDWRSNDPLDGFAPPADPAWPLRAEAASRDRVDREATLVYSRGIPAEDDRGSGDGVTVHTSSSSTISAGYLETWYLEGSGDGTGPLVTYRDDGHELSFHWPDGRSVLVSPQGEGSSLTRDELVRIATSVSVATAADLIDVRDAAERMIEAQPVVATAATAIGTVEVHGDGGIVRLCLRRPGSSDADCDTSTMGGNVGPDGSARATTQWTLDGSWNVAVASRGEVPRIMDSSDTPITPSELVDVPADTSVVGDWTVQFVQPPPEVDAICIGSAAAASCFFEQQPE